MNTINATNQPGSIARVNERATSASITSVQIVNTTESTSANTAPGGRMNPSAAANRAMYSAYQPLGSATTNVTINNDAEATTFNELGLSTP